PVLAAHTQRVRFGLGSGSKRKPGQPFSSESRYPHSMPAGYAFHAEERNARGPGSKLDYFRCESDGAGDEPTSPIVSVLIATRDRPALLRSAIESGLAAVVLSVRAGCCKRWR